MVKNSIEKFLFRILIQINTKIEKKICLWNIPRFKKINKQSSTTSRVISIIQSLF